MENSKDCPFISYPQSFGNTRMIYLFHVYKPLNKNKKISNIKKELNRIEILWSLQYAIMFHVYVLIENINVFSRDNDKYNKEKKILTGWSYSRILMK